MIFFLGIVFNFFLLRIQIVNKKVNWLTIYLLFSTLDYFIPGVLNTIFKNNLYLFNYKIIYNELLIGSSFYFSAHFIFVLLAFLYLNKFDFNKTYSVKKSIVLKLFFVIFLLKFIEIFSFGNIQTWFFVKSTERWSQYTNNLIQNPSLYNLSIFWQPLVYRILLILVYVCEINRQRLTRIFWVLLFIYALTNFFRGALVHIFLLFIGINIYKKRISTHKLSKYAILGFLTLVLYGSVRDIEKTEKLDIKASIVNVFSGHGLHGFHVIFNEFGTSIDYLNGKTYIDMLLLPIPRSIWKSKPTWYGIDDINKALGYPSTTQTAVSWPGELYANFGYTGLVLVPVLFFSFKMIDILLGLLSLRIVREVIFVPLIFVFNWMSFTGYMNTFIYLVPILFIVSAFKKFIFK